MRSGCTGLSRRGLLQLLPLGLVVLGRPRLGHSQVATPPREPPAERIIPLGPATVRELHGSAWAISLPRKGQPPGTQPSRRQLKVGDKVTAGEQVQTGAPSAGAAATAPAEDRIQLVFGDQTQLRLAADTLVTLMSDERRCLLGRGRVLVQGDRSLGGLSVWLQRLALLPEGTTYLVELLPSAQGAAQLTVLEGSVSVCPITASNTLLPATEERTVLPGEQVLLHEPKLNRRIRPLAQALASEPLLTRFATPLPSLPQLTDLSKQQVRGVLAGRNQRLRRELFWKRPPRKPLQLPALLAVPGSVEIRYYYPE